MFLTSSISPELSSVKAITQVNNYSIIESDVRDYLRYGSNNEDPTISLMIKSVFSQIERYLDRSIIRKKYQANYKVLGNEINLPFGAAESIVSVSTLDRGIPDLADSADYFLQSDCLYIDGVYNNIAGKVVYWSGEISEFTSVASTNIINIESHSYIDGDIIRLSGFLTGGLESGIDYYVINSTVDTLQLSLTSGGAAIDITLDGDGFIGELDHTLKLALVKTIADEFNYRGNQGELSTYKLSNNAMKMLAQYQRSPML